MHNPDPLTTALESAVKLLLVENDCLRESCRQKLHNGCRDFPPIELARGADTPGLVSFHDGTLSVRLES